MKKIISAVLVALAMFAGTTPAEASPEAVPIPQQAFFPVPLKTGAFMTYQLYRRVDSGGVQALGMRTIEVLGVDKTDSSLSATVKQTDFDGTGQPVSSGTYQFIQQGKWVMAASGKSRVKLFPFPLKTSDFLEATTADSNLSNNNWTSKGDTRWSTIEGVSRPTQVGDLTCSMVMSRYLGRAHYSIGTFKPDLDWTGTIESTRSIVLTVAPDIGLVQMQTRDEAYGKGLTPPNQDLVLTYSIATYSIPVSTSSTPVSQD